MDWRAACAAVVPCLNEEQAIGPLVESVRHYLPTVLVVDDGSSDQTARRAEQAGGVVLRHAVSLGKGRALKAGWTRARQQGFSWVLTMDGDGQHAPEDIPRFLECAQLRGASLVVGNRMSEASGMPLVRRWVNRWMSWQISKLAGRDLPDSQCGFRLMDLRQWERLSLVSDHFEVESEVLFAFARAGMVIEFVPVRVIYKQEQSKIHPWRDTIRWLRWRRNACRSLSGSMKPKVEA